MSIDTENWHYHAWRNRLQAFLLLVFMATFLALLGWLLAGFIGLLILMLFGITAFAVTPQFSPMLVMRLYRAVEIQPHQFPELWSLIQQLSERAGMDYVPRLFYVPTSVVNSFAAGSKSQAAIGITDGLLRNLNIRELAGVLAHEISHIRNNDVWVMNLADMLTRTTQLFSLFGQLLLLFNLPLMLLGAVTFNWFAIALLIFAPSLSALAQLALARNREFEADLNAIRLTLDPDGLASALYKLEQIQGGWMERVFMSNRRLPDPSPLRTHPQTQVRIDRLMTLKSHMPEAQHTHLEEMLDLLSHYGDPVTRKPRRHLTGLWH